MEDGAVKDIGGRSHGVFQAVGTNVRAQDLLFLVLVDDGVLV